MRGQAHAWPLVICNVLYNVGMAVQKIIENTFFFSILVGVAFLMWRLLQPFGGTLALAAIVVTICYPVYEHILARWCRGNVTCAASLSVLMVIFVVALPITILGSFLLREAISMYKLFDSSSSVSITASFSEVENFVRVFVPDFTINIASVAEQAASFVTGHLVGLFTSTASMFFYFFLTLIGTFYFFRDGKTFTSYLVRLSPLRDQRDGLILHRIAQAVRAVALGSVLVSIIQGILTSIGLSLFGFSHAVLWGCVASIGALVPGVGTAIVFIPAIAYLIFTGAHLAAIGVAIWATLAVGLIDNLLGPYFMSRGNPLHPFVILLSVLGGIALFGPIGFVLGPVIATLFTVLIEMYATYVKD